MTTTRPLVLKQGDKAQAAKQPISLWGHAQSEAEERAGVRAIASTTGPHPNPLPKGEGTGRQLV